MHSLAASLTPAIQSVRAMLCDVEIVALKSFSSYETNGANPTDGSSIGDDDDLPRLRLGASKRRHDNSWLAPTQTQGFASASSAPPKIRFKRRIFSSIGAFPASPSPTSRLASPQRHLSILLKTLALSLVATVATTVVIATTAAVSSWLVV